MMKNENRSTQILKDVEVINLAKASKIGSKFNLLFNEGKIPEDLIDIADINERIKKSIGQLVFYIYFYTQDSIQIKRILRQSALCNGNKYTDEYLQDVIDTVAETMKDGQYYKKAKIGTRELYYIQGKNNKMYLNKEKFIEFLREEHKLIVYKKKYYIYKENHYVEQTENDIKRLIKKYLLDEDISINLFKEIFSSIEFQCESTQTEMFDFGTEQEKEKVFIPTKTGIYFPFYDKLVASDSSFISNVYYDYTINKEYECPNWINFLNKALPEDSIKLLQQYMGYILFPYNRAQKALVLMGVPRSGKSTILNLIEKIVGQENTSGLTIEAIGEKFSKQNLIGKAVNISTEYGDAISTKQIQFLKQLIAADMMFIDMKNKEGITTRINSKFIFATNEMLEFKKYDEAMLRRLMFINLKNSIPVNEVDFDFGFKLEQEKEAIFNWALEGLRELMQNNFHFVEVKDNNKILEHYKPNKQEANKVETTIRDFIERGCILDKNASVEIREFYERYNNYCEDEGEEAVPNKEVKKALLDTYKFREHKDSVSRRTTIVGLKFIE